MGIYGHLAGAPPGKNNNGGPKIVVIFSEYPPQNPITVDLLAIFYLNIEY